MSRADKTITNAYYEVEIDPESVLPLRIRITVLTGRKGATITKKKKIVGGEHVAFHFEYRLSRFNGVEPLTVPPDAGRVLAKL